MNKQEQAASPVRDRDIFSSGRLSLRRLIDYSQPPGVQEFWELDYRTTAEEKVPISSGEGHDPARIKEAIETRLKTITARLRRARERDRPERSEAIVPGQKPKGATREGHDPKSALEHYQVTSKNDTSQTTRRTTPDFRRLF